MHKHIYLIRGNERENYPAYTFRIFEAARILAGNEAVKKLKVAITTTKPPSLSVIPFSKKKIAAFSIISDNGTPIHELLSHEGFSGGFKVTEAVPLAYEKTWNDSEETPGIGLLTLFHKKREIDHDTFLDRWHNGHTPLSLKLHPLWNYNRNVVNEKLTEHDFWFDGIVEEHFRERRDLLNIFRFFGKPHKVLSAMWQVYSDSSSFINYKTIETYLISEYHIKS
jgi:hypothetical protein